MLQNRQEALLKRLTGLYPEFLTQLVWEGRHEKYLHFSLLPQ